MDASQIPNPLSHNGNSKFVFLTLFNSISKGQLGPLGQYDVNFLCHPGWVKGCPDSNYFWVCLGGTHETSMRIRGLSKTEPPAKRRKIIQSEESPHRTKRQSSCLCFLPGWLSWDMCLLPPLALDLHCPLLWPSGSNWIYTLGFPGSPAFGQYLSRLLGLHNPMSEFPIRNPIYRHTHN